MFAVVVRLQVGQEHRSALLDHLRANAATSRAQEPGCHRFDICHNPAPDSEVLLYELYDDRAAFEAHLASAHYAAFDAATKDLIAAKTVTTYEDVII